MAEKYKLYYFHIYGRAETARMMFTLAGVEFEDFRFTRREWPALKPQMPLEQVPILETSEGVVSQSAAINIFVADRTGFMPEESFYRTQAISVVITTNDLISSISSNIFVYEIYKTKPIPDDIEEKKQNCITEISEVVQFVKGVGKDGVKFIFDDKVTVADIALFVTMESIYVVIPEDTIDNNWLKKFMFNMREEANIAKYLKERPPSMAGV